MVQRRRGGRGKAGELNLVSLMDMFTILVIFLLFQALNEGETLPIEKDLILPLSTASQPPRPNLTVTVTSKEVRVEGLPVTDSPSALEDSAPVISELKERLLSKGAQRVTIVGDRKIPFALLKKVMVTCMEAGVEQISLAVLSRE